MIVYVRPETCQLGTCKTIDNIKMCGKLQTKWNELTMEDEINNETYQIMNPKRFEKKDMERNVHSVCMLKYIYDQTSKSFV